MVGEGADEEAAVTVCGDYRDVNVGAGGSGSLRPSSCDDLLGIRTTAARCGTSV